MYYFLAIVALYKRINISFISKNRLNEIFRTMALEQAPCHYF